LARSSALKAPKNFTDCGADSLDGAGCGLAQQVLELAEDRSLFDGVEVR
jgi:hypothetical protein